MTPSDFLRQRIDNIPKGRALDIGAGEGELSIWLAQKGFQVDAIESDPDACSRLEARSKGLIVTIHSMDVRDYSFPEGEYSLVYAGAILHFLKPTDLWVLADRIVLSLVQGGFFIAQVFTTDDPGYEELRDSGAEEIEPNTFISAVLEEPIHYFMPGELARTFSALKIQAYEESRIVDPADPVGFRSGASIVARKV
jgi:trans-aconitate methyltransferase